MGLGLFVQAHSTTRRGTVAERAHPPIHVTLLHATGGASVPTHKPSGGRRLPFRLWLFLQAHSSSPDLGSSRSMSWRWTLARRVATLAAIGGGGAQAQRLLSTSSAGGGTGLLGRHYIPLASQIRSKVHCPVPFPYFTLCRWCLPACWRPSCQPPPALCLRLCRAPVDRSEWRS